MTKSFGWKACLLFSGVALFATHAQAASVADIDVNGDGYITEAEFEFYFKRGNHRVPAKIAKAAMKKYDLDGSGKVSVAEINAIAKSSGNGTSSGSRSQAGTSDSNGSSNANSASTGGNTGGNSGNGGGNGNSSGNGNAGGGSSGDNGNGGGRNK